MPERYAEKYTRNWTVEKELRRSIVDLIRGNEPTTVLGLLMVQPEEISESRSPHPTRRALTPYLIAGLIGQEAEDVFEIVDRLDKEDLVLTITENGISKVRAFAGFSERNGSPTFTMPVEQPQHRIEDILPLEEGGISQTQANLAEALHRSGGFPELNQ